MNINGLEITIGADPELFISKDGKPYSAFGLIDGTKRNPLSVDNGAVQVDGMALEFNIDPAEDEETFLKNISSVKETLLSMIPKDYTELQDCSVEFDFDHFKEQPYAALELGCEPDFNGRNGKMFRKPNAIENKRTAGGHVHIGGFQIENMTEEQHFDFCCRFAQIMDEQVGVYSVLWDDDSERRKMYGRASAFRPKSYGIEYRTMSNKWIFNPQLVKTVYNFTIDAVKKSFDVDYKVNQDVFSIINNSEKTNPFFNNNSKADLIKQIVEG